MLGSLNSSSSRDQEEEDPSSSDLHVHQIPQASHISPATHMRQLLINCAEHISQSDFAAAHRLLTILSSSSSPYGDSTERLLHQFVKALSLRLSRHQGPSSSSSELMMSIDANPINSTSGATTSSRYDTIDYYSSLQSCYLSLNQITPFIRFCHLTANQAILEAIEVGQQAIHILDFDIMHGVQWPPLMQALAERSNNSLHPPPMLRITGTGNDLNILNRTGDRLLKFAQSLGLRFQFHPLLVLNDDPSSVALYLPSALAILPDEALAVNCVLYLHRLLKYDSRDLRLFLHKIKALNPRVVTIAEREASHNHPLFLQRFVEALDHYTSIFDSLEATLPPNSRERLAVEQIWFGREIMDIVAAEGENRSERHERFESWELMLRSSGFSNVPLSPYALSQAKLLLRLHYPSEGYQLQILNHSFFLGWQNRTLFSVSSWH
ncbi:GRAS domain-containing protein [Cephalotus follicularis]|uniref:GRAS domain-containing protein n=1 Tax=Cephalotus follicularis TaxID=3775 RepID=A0A1Q3BNV0_CEPFO|nr:GRAS domain-containing protein [Cephalotus follicularis]